MSPNLQAVLDFLARTDLDGHHGGPALVWSVLSGLAALAVVIAVAAPFCALLRGPRHSTRVSVRPERRPDYVLRSPDGTELYRGWLTTGQPDPTPQTAEEPTP